MNYKNSSESPFTIDAGSPRPVPAAVSQIGKDGVHDQYFRTDHLLKNLEKRSVSGGFITCSSQGIQFALNLGSTMILARMLEPRDFGLLAMVWAVIAMLAIFRDVGLSAATIQREGITHNQVSNLFWVNLAVSGIASVLMAASAPLIAWFYQEPRLMGITLVLSSVFLLSGLTAQHMALLNRQMRFMAVAVIQVVSALTGVLVGVGMAWFHCGYWSLVGMSLTTSLVAVLMAWSISPWRPHFFKRHSGTRSLLHFGASLAGGWFLYSAARGLDGVLIGRFCGAVPLGLYSRAAAMLARPLEQFVTPIQAVVIPAFSRLQSQPERYRQNFMKLYEGMALLGFVSTGMFFALAHPLTLVILGAKWEKAAPVFAALSFVGVLFPLRACASWLLISQGRGRDTFVGSCILSVIVALSFIAGLPFGPLGVAIAYAAGCLLIQNPVYYWLVGRRGPVRTVDLWIGFLKHLPAWAFVTLTAWLMLKAVPNFHPLAQLLMCIPASILAGITFILIYTPSRHVVFNLLSAFREMRTPVQAVEDQNGNEAKMSPSIAAMRRHSNTGSSCISVQRCRK